MPTVAFVTPEEHAAEIGALRAEFYDMLGAYVTDHEQWVETDEALRLTGIKARSTLVLTRASVPEAEEAGCITYRKDGRKCLYARSSCVNYRRNKRGQPTLRP